MKQAKPSKLHVWSAPLLLRIHALPRYVFPLFTLVLLFLLVGALPLRPETEDTLVAWRERVRTTEPARPSTAAPPPTTSR